MIYWLYLIVKSTRSIQENEMNCTVEMLCLIFVPFYSLYWWHTRGEKVKQELSQRNCASTGNRIVYLIFGVFGLSIVSMAIIQSDFNSLEHLEQRSAQKKHFYYYARPLFKEGLMKELYCSDTFSVCNVADTLYYVFPFEIYNNFELVPDGVAFEKRIIDLLLKNENNFKKILLAHGLEYINNNMLSLNHENIELMRQIRKRNDAEGPSEMIDKNWEEKVRNKNNKLKKRQGGECAIDAT